MTQPFKLFAAVSLGLALAMGMTGCADSGDKSLEAARAYMEQKQYESAILLLKTHLQESPTSAQGRFLFGQALLASGDASGAEIELVRALERGHPKAAVVPALAQAMFRQGKQQALLERFGAETLGDAAADQDLGTTLAQALATSGQLDAARARLHHVLAANPQYGPALLVLALVQSRTGEVDAALVTLDGLLQRAPGNADGWQARGDLLRQKGDLEGAATAYTRGLAADPKSAGLHSSLIAVHYLRQDDAAAERQFQAMKEALPKHPLTRYQEAIYSFQKGDFATAAERLQPVVLAFPERVDVLWLAGATDLQRGALSQAEAHLAKVVSLQPGLVVPRRLLAQLHMRANQPHKALAVVRPAADQPDADAETLTVAAYSALLAADSQAADRYFARAESADSGSAGTRTSLALALAQLSKGRAEPALAQLQTLAAGDTGTAADLALVGLRLRRGEYAAALKAIDALEAKTPKSPVPSELRARVQVALRNTTGARQAYEQALARQADYMPAVNGIAALDLLEGKRDAARQRFEAVIKANPRNVQAYLSLAQFDMLTGAGTDAVTRHLGDAVKANPLDPEPRLALIAHLRSQGDAKGAVDAARVAVEALPGQPHLVEQLGRAQLAAGDLNQAAATFGRLASEQPQLAAGPIGQAEVALARKDFDTAARMARRALDLDTRSLEAMPVAITALTSAKRHDEAVAVTRSLQAQWPDEAIGFILEGEVEWARGRWDAAAQAFRVATKKPKPAQSPGRLHASLAKAGKTADAARFAGGWLTEHSKDTLFMLYLADAASQAGDRAGAERLYRQVLVVEPGNPMALNNFAVLLLAQNRPGALELAQRAVKAAPGRIALQDTLASALAQAGQTAQAIEVQKKLVAAAPQVPAYQLQLVRLYLQVGDNAAARTELKRLGAIDKPFPGREDLPELLRQTGG